ncbi:Late secretory pathway protein AVL9 [Galdieria sulphuraria]|nr:Late secretory pathway protein AVL9 [Galdieria sulphuraria]
MRTSSPKPQIDPDSLAEVTNNMKQQNSIAAVAYVLVMGFHATKGCCLEYAYPRLELDSTNLGTQGSDLASPLYSTSSPREETSGKQGTSLDASSSVEKQLLKSLSLLPSMALPDGVHERDDDSVFFRVDDKLFGVACFRQVAATSISSFSADPRASREQERDFASRGTIQKSVVLLSKYPLFGVLLEHLRPVVSIYFEQGDFKRTNILAQLYHSVNAALSCNQHCLYSSAFLYHGLELRRIIRRLGFHTLRIVKLLLLEKKVLLHSSPVESASNAVLSLASIFPGGLSYIAESTHANDSTVSLEQSRLGFPLNCFRSNSSCVLEPYAPLQRLQQLLGFRKAMNDESIDEEFGKANSGFLAGTSRNLGLLIASMTDHYEQSEVGGAALNPPDAFVDITLGEVQYAPWVEELCRLTRRERRFMENLISIISNSFPSRLGRFRLSQGKHTDYLHSEEYARERFHEYLQQFLISIASIPNVLNKECWSDKFDIQTMFRSDMIENYGLPFCQAWLTTNIFDTWRKSCDMNVLFFTRSMESKLPPKMKTDNVSPPHLRVQSSSCTTSPLQGKSQKVDRRLVFQGYHSDSGDEETTVSDRLKRIASNISSRWNMLVLGGSFKYQKSSEVKSTRFEEPVGDGGEVSVYKDPFESSWNHSHKKAVDDSTGLAVIDTQDIVEGLF